MDATSVTRWAAAAAALALLAVPHRKVVVEYLSKAIERAEGQSTYLTRAAAVCLLLFAFGGDLTSLVPSRGISLPSLDLLIASSKGLFGASLIAVAVFLFARPPKSRQAETAQFTLNLLLLAVGILLAGEGPTLAVPKIEWRPPTIVQPAKVTAAVYVYEKSDGPVPAGVHSGIDRLNRDKKITASLFEDDTVDGSGDTPEQYKPALAAAKAKSIPALVVLAGTNAVNVVVSPQTEADVWEAVP